MIDYTKIILANYPDAFWTLDGDDYAGLTWLSDSPKPSKKTLDDLWESVEAEILAQKESKIAAKESAIAKLSALGLTEDESKAIIG